MFNSQLGFYRNLSDTCASLHDADDGYTIACASCTGTSRPERFVDGVVYIRRGDVRFILSAVTREGLAEDAVVIGEHLV